MDLDTHSVFVSRDVQFHESIIPFQSLNSTCSDASLPILPTLLANDQTTSLLIPHVVPISNSDIPIANCTNSTNPSLIPPIDSLASNPEPPVDSSSFPLRKSTRIHKAPSYLQDYTYNVLVSKPSPGAPYDINQCISNANITASHKAFVFAASAEIEQEFFHQTVVSKAWQQAINKEIPTLELNHA